MNLKKIKLSHLLLFAAFLYLSFQAFRNVAVAAVVMATLAMRNISQPGLAVRTEKTALPAAVVFLLFMLGFIISVSSGGYYIKNRLSISPGFGAAWEKFPRGAISFIKDKGLQGSFYNDNFSGGFFLWECYPERKVFFDGRWEGYSKEFLGEFHRLSQNPGAFGEYADKYGFKYVLLSHFSPESRKLFPLLFKDGGWILAFIDESASVFVRKGLAGLKAARPETDMKEKPASGWPLYLNYFQRAVILQNAGLYEFARKDYERALEILPSYHEAANNSGYTWAMQGNYEKAAEFYLRALEIKKSYAPAKFNLGYSYYRLGRYKQAINALKNHRALSPGNKRDAFIITAECNLKTGNYRETIENCKRAIKTDGNLPAAYNLMGIAYGKQALYTEALEVFKAAAAKFPGNEAIIKNLRNMKHVK